MNKDELVEILAQTIARVEGFFLPNSRSMRNNNPGNLRVWWRFPYEGGFVKFPDPETGWECLRKQINKNIARGLTFREFFGGKPGVYKGYAPAADSNRPDKYAEMVYAAVAKIAGHEVPKGVDALLTDFIYAEPPQRLEIL